MKWHFCLWRRAAGAALLAMWGCNGLHESAPPAEFYAQPGVYPPPPDNAPRPRVGIPVPAVQIVTGADPTDRAGEDAAEALLTLAQASERFNPVDRTRLAELIGQQGLSGMLRPGALVHPAPLEGIDYLLLCSIENLSITGNAPPPKVSAAEVENLLHISKPEEKMNTSAIVELKLVDPRTGKSLAEVTDSFNRSCPPMAMGFATPPPDAVNGQYLLNDDQLNRVVKVVLDDALRKLLPDVDSAIGQLPHNGVALFTPPTTELLQPGGALNKPGARPAALTVRCPECGFQCSIYDEFCPNCGTRLPTYHPATQPTTTPAGP
jgi:hypothetical protein